MIAFPPLDLSGTLTELLAAARGGDDLAFSEIHRRFARVVHGIALAHVGAADAEDVAQEVFGAVHRALATVRDPAAFPAWICTLARNRSLDWLRRRRAAPRAVPLDDALPAPRGADDGEARELLLRALGALPDAYRETLLLRLAEGLTGPEIAERTGLTPGSVRVNLARGMAMLRERLATEGWR